VPPEVQFDSCSEQVGAALGRDVMKSVKHLIPDLLDALPLLLFQGGLGCGLLILHAWAHGLVCVGVMMGWAGLGWAGLVWAGLGWVGLGWDYPLAGPVQRSCAKLAAVGEHGLLGVQHGIKQHGAVPNRGAVREL
jgi:hypothetical protein